MGTGMSECVLSVFGSGCVWASVGCGCSLMGCVGVMGSDGLYGGNIFDGYSVG